MNPDRLRSRVPVARSAGGSCSVLLLWRVGMVVCRVAGLLCYIHGTVLLAAASAAGPETLIGLCGDGFVLLAADAVASGGGHAFVTSRTVDKIALMSQNNMDSLERPRVAVAAVGNAADADQLVGLLRAKSNLAHYEHLDATDIHTINPYDFGNGTLETVVVDCRVDPYFCTDERKNEGVVASQSASRMVPAVSTTSLVASTSWPMPVAAVAQLARCLVAQQLRQSSSPYRVCLLIAGMAWHNNKQSENKTMQEQQQQQPSMADRIQSQVAAATAPWREPPSDELGLKPDTDSVTTTPTTTTSQERNSDKLSQRDVSDGGTAIATARNNCDGSPNRHRLQQRRQLQPVLYWLDEYGALQRVPYGVHGMASDLLWSILDQGYHTGMSLPDAIRLLQKCLAALRTRYLINTQQTQQDQHNNNPFCVKCIDAKGCRVIDITADIHIAAP